MAGGVASIGLAVALLAIQPTLQQSTERAAERRAATDPVAPGAEARRPGEIVNAKEYRFSSWQEAHKAASFALREPSWVPDGFWLSALQSFVPDLGADSAEIDAVVASFTGPRDSYVTVDQFWIAKPDEFDLDRSLPNPPASIASGVVAVGAQSARWQAGVVDLDAAGDPVGWDSSVLVVTWVDGQTGYRLAAKNLDLATVVRIAESLIYVR